MARMNSKRIITWASFIIVVGLIIWGLVAANNKSAHESDLLPLPDQITATDHIRGSATAPVTLVEYGDFQCPACEAFFPIVEKVLNDEGSSTVRFVFRHFPLPQHQNAIPAVIASEAAYLQGQFWGMYELLYGQQSDWSESTDPTAVRNVFIGYAKKLNLDVTKFTADLDSKDLMAIANNSYAAAQKANLDHTPTFFVNGTEINPQGYDDLKKSIDDAITATTTNP